MLKLGIFLAFTCIASVSSCGVQDISLECPGTKCIERLRDANGCLTCECDDNPTRMDDMKFTPEVVNFVQIGMGKRPSKAAANNFALWNNIRSGDKYVIPYAFDSAFPTKGRTAVAAAIVDFNALTCLKFIPRTSETEYMLFYVDNGCFANVGRVTDASVGNKISLGDGCQFKGIAIHEIMHSLGFFHEHQRPDRDTYVKIQLANVQKDKVDNFEKLTNIDSLGVAYDIKSIMQYSGTAFSISTGTDAPTITMPDGSPLVGYQEIGLAQSDVDQINLLYKCSAIATTVKPTITPSTAGTAIPNPTCKNNYSDCDKWAAAGRCVSLRFKRFVRYQCPKSCGVCTTTGTLQCFDARGPSCIRLKKLCNYTPVVRKVCKRTCGFC